MLIVRFTQDGCHHIEATDCCRGNISPFGKKVSAIFPLVSLSSRVGQKKYSLADQVSGT